MRNAPAPVRDESAKFPYTALFPLCIDTRPSRPHPRNCRGENSLHNAALAGFRPRLQRVFIIARAPGLDPPGFASARAGQPVLISVNTSTVLNVDIDYATVEKAGQRCFQRRLLRDLRRLGYGCTTPSSLS